MDFSAQQLQYLSFLTDRRSPNLALLGGAGTGKTTLLRRGIELMREMGQQVAVCAPTGIAAQQLGGTTVAKLLGLRNARNLNEWGKVDFNQANNNLLFVETIVLDEISIQSGDQLELVDHVLQEVRGNELPFGGIRMIFCGDFLQIPPVRGHQEPEFDKKWAFEYGPWADVVTLTLSENFRQSNKIEHQFLNAVRQGRCNSSMRQYMEEMLQRPLIDPVYLYPNRKTVDSINETYLKALPGQLYYYPTSVSNVPFELVAKDLPIGQQVLIKENCPVIILANDPEGSFVNGSQGRVRRVFRHRTLVELTNGAEVSVPLWNWKIKRGQETAHVSGMPLQVGRACTIHRAQGMTLEAVATDLRRCWEGGQAYVALSRARSLAKVSLDTIPGEILADPLALAYTESLKD